MKIKMKNKKQLEKKYVDELKDEYNRLGEIRAKELAMGGLVYVIVLLALYIIAF